MFRTVIEMSRKGCFTGVRNYTQLRVSDINPHVLRLEYAVRGPIVQRASELQSELCKGQTLPFDQIIRCNIGDCHAAGQKPVTFIRQVLSAATNPELLQSSVIPEDAKLRAKRFLDSCGGSIGSYSQSTGVQVVREDAAQYIQNRDDLPSNPDDIFLTNGASEAVKALLQLLSTTLDGPKRAGIMVPIPQYPLYSATNAEYNACQLGYYLDESNGWGIDVNQLEQVIQNRKTTCQPRAIVVINPGNPTGQLLTTETIRKLLQFAYRHNLVILADEVYQHNVYTTDRKFISFKRVLHDMGEPLATSVQLASFMSCSKGYMGECGLRGGYCELVNFDPDVKAQLYKCLSARLCSAVLGQLAMDVVVNPPREGEPSYEQFEAEKKNVLDSLKHKAQLLTDSLNSIPGFSCNPITGAMYAFPQIKLPPKAIEAAKSKNVAPDFMFCLELLEKTGICVVPGSGFGQVSGTWHFRTTILPPVEQMKLVVAKLEEFSKNFMEKYS